MAGHGKRWHNARLVAPGSRHLSSASEFQPGCPELEGVSEDCARLVDALRVTDAPPEILAQVRRQIGSALELLGAHTRAGPHMQSVAGVRLFHERLIAAHELMPYSPIIGRMNPVSPRLVFRSVGERLEGSGSFPVRFVGAPQTVHGGIVAAALDEIMGLANFLNGVGSFTGTMTVRYHRPTPIETELTIVGEMLEHHGRKVKSRAEIRCDGVVTASAEGLFICPR